jgi:hypothetical protein
MEEMARCRRRVLEAQLLAESAELQVVKVAGVMRIGI